MTKRTILCLSVVFFATSVGNAMNYAGPFPMPYPAQTYNTTNPTSHMDFKQRLSVQEAFKFIQNSFQINHNQCETRGACLNLDLTALLNYIRYHPNHPVNPIFRNIYTIIHQDARHQIFTTQWVIFKNLSPQRQQEFRNGLRILPLKPQMVRVRKGNNWITAPAYYDQDDVLTVLLEEIEHSHRSCTEYTSCLSNDQQILKSLYNRLDAADPTRRALSELSQIIKNLSDHYPFDTTFYLNLYNPLGPDWYDILKKHKVKHLTAYGHQEWKQTQQNTRALNWYLARPTNGQIINQTPTQQGFRTYSKQEWPRIRSSLQEHGQPLREWWQNSKDFFKKWYKG